MTYDRDADGNRTSMDDSLGGLVSYTYNARDELTNETLSGTDISAIAVANIYDNAGNMTGQKRYSNTAETDVVATTSYTYDDAEQMTGITDKNSGGTTLVSYGYTYDAAGLVTQETRSWDSGSDTDTLDYTYTNNDQLTGVTHTDDAFANESFSYDANGNETGTGFTTSTGNEQTASPGFTYTYDADGNMITSTDTSTGDTWTYSYNFAGQMTGAVETNTDDTVIAQATYTYDALGNRIGMDENGTQTWTLYDGSDPIMDFNGSGSLEMRYLNGPTGQLVDSVLARESAGGTVAWYLPDRLGTIRDLINNSGSIIDHIDFSAFGTVLDRVRPIRGRPDDGLRRDGAGFGYGDEPGGSSGAGSGNGEVDESGSIGVCGGGCGSLPVREERPGEPCGRLWAAGPCRRDSRPRWARPTAPERTRIQTTTLHDNRQSARVAAEGLEEVRQPVRQLPEGHRQAGGSKEGHRKGVGQDGRGRPFAPELTITNNRYRYCARQTAQATGASPNPR